jgi:hypothetical protein
MIAKRVAKRIVRGVYSLAADLKDRRGCVFQCQHISALARMLRVRNDDTQGQRPMKQLWLILAAFLGLASQAVPASAAIQYTLNCSTLACTGTGSGNYGTVTLTQSGAVGAETIHVDVSLASGITFGGNNTHSLLWNGLTNDNLSVTNLTGNASTFNVVASGANGSYAASPFTTATQLFDYEIDRSNNSGTPTALSFDVTKTGGLTLANFATGNDGGVFFFASFIHQNSSNTNFFVASNQEGIQVPEPGTLTLSIAGLAGLAGLALVQRRRYRAQAR